MLFRDAGVRSELSLLEKDSSEKLQLIDILRFQTNEIKGADLNPTRMQSSKKKSVGSITSRNLLRSATEAYALLYDNAESTATTLEKAERQNDRWPSSNRNLANTARHKVRAGRHRGPCDRCSRFSRPLEFSPERLEEIENRLAEIAWLKRKYGDSIELSRTSARQRRPFA